MIELRRRTQDVETGEPTWKVIETYDDTPEGLRDARIDAALAFGRLRLARVLPDGTEEVVHERR